MPVNRQHADATASVRPVENQQSGASEHDSGHGYLTVHLRGTRAGGHYKRSRYAAQAWQTFGVVLPDDRSARLLMVGPGECEFEELLTNEQGYRQVEIVDISDEVVQYAKQLGFVATHTDDLVSFLESQPGSFDRIVLLHVLEHIPKSATIDTLRAARGALRRGGALLIEVPNMADPFNASYFRYADFTHEVGFTEESLRYVLTHAGFDTINFLPARGAANPVVRWAQTLTRRVARLLLVAISLPNGRQMLRRIDPVLSVSASDTA
jgi:2-polyprenyl-3-methyl-5-hydroxy-6-metoxy-1,4-benzoquinol methylase